MFFYNRTTLDCHNEQSWLVKKRKNGNKNITGTAISGSLRGGRSDAEDVFTNAEVVNGLGYAEQGGDDEDAAGSAFEERSQTFLLRDPYQGVADALVPLTDGRRRFRSRDGLVQGTWSSSCGLPGVEECSLGLVPSLDSRFRHDGACRGRSFGAAGRQLFGRRLALSLMRLKNGQRSHNQHLVSSDESPTWSRVLMTSIGLTATAATPPAVHPDMKDQ